MAFPLSDEAFRAEMKGMGFGEKQAQKLRVSLQKPAPKVPEAPYSRPEASSQADGFTETGPITPQEKWLFR
ncbi:MAG: hypothetical protein PW734_09385 [Verrucomicrobium sp.]|nr:hypothetical protein [Verrucomicrobium sp.]